MAVELDHLFVCVSAGGEEARRLVQFGLTEGPPNRHPGQGTANRRFVFAGAFLELLWVDEPDAAQREPAAPLRLWDRWTGRRRDASPFGIGFRPAAGGPPDWPFATWSYRPAYLPDPLAIDVGANCRRVDEPLLFCLAFGGRPDAGQAPRRQPIEHAAGLRSIDRVRMTVLDRAGASDELRAAERACDWLCFDAGDEPLVQIGFDGESAGKSHDFRPDLPLLFRWQPPRAFDC